MTKGRIALFGSAMAVLLCGAGVASAQTYYDGYSDRGYQDRDYDQVDPVSETIIVHPNDVIEQQQLLGRVDGEMNPQAYTISRAVAFSDLNLDRSTDRAELHDRIYQTASDLCAELDARVPGLSGDSSADRECVRDATRNAMRDVMAHYYG
ncbi:MAG TPA: UrcA family protein [Rhizomicrobium sp.]|jgi:UrcA family protein|nr:UrcA family protein [Rhizomicrobium sp.]